MATLYFAFGSNLSHARLQARVGEVEVVGPAQLGGWRHRFNKRGHDGTGKGNIEVADEHVWGVLYRLSSAQMATLDGFEGGYRRQVLQLEGVEATTYVGLDPGPCLTPARWYLEHYRVGIEEHGLPPAWLEAVERHAALGTGA